MMDSYCDQFYILANTPVIRLLSILKGNMCVCVCIYWNIDIHLIISYYRGVHMTWATCDQEGHLIRGTFDRGDM